MRSCGECRFYIDEICNYIVNYPASMYACGGGMKKYMKSDEGKNCRCFESKIKIFKIRRMKNWTDKERQELKNYFEEEITKAHINDNWWNDKILEIEERYQQENNG